MKQKIKSILSIFCIFTLLITSLPFTALHVDAAEEDAYGALYSYIVKDSVTVSHDGHSGYWNAGTYHYILNGKYGYCSAAWKAVPTHKTYTSINKYYVGNSSKRAKAFYYFGYTWNSETGIKQKNTLTYEGLGKPSTYLDVIDKALSVSGYSNSGLNRYGFSHELISYLQQGTFGGDNRISPSWETSIRAIINKLDDVPNVPAAYKIYYIYPGNSNTQSLMGIEESQGYLRIKKESSDNKAIDHGYSVKGAVFQLYKSDQKTLYSSKKYTSDKDGYTDCITVPFGTYYVKEITAPSGFSLNSNMTKVVVSDGNRKALGTSEAAVAVVKNPPVKTYVKLAKTSATPSITTGNSNYSLAGAVYGIYTDAKATTPAFSSASDYKRTTNSKGETELWPALYAGVYYIKEITPSKGYSLDSTIHKVTLKYGTHTSSKPAIVTSQEPPIKGWAYVKKESTNPSLLSQDAFSVQGAQFKFFKEQTCVTPIGNALISGEDGKSNLVELPLGTYWAKEIAPPKGHSLNTNTYKVTVTESNTKTNPAYVTIKNEPLVSGVRIIKKSSNPTFTAGNNNYSLSDAKFNIYYSSNGEITDRIYKENLSTNSQGVIEIDNVPAGTYFVKETQPPKGFKLNTTPQKLVVKAGSPCEVTFENEPLGFNPQFRKNGNTYSDGVVYEFNIYPGTYTNLSQIKDVTPSWTYFVQTKQATNGLGIIDSYHLLPGSDEPIDGGKFPLGLFTVKEVVPPRAFLLDETTHFYRAVPQLSANGTYRVHIYDEEGEEVYRGTAGSFAANFQDPPIEPTTIKIRKSWIDGGDRDGIRPDSVIAYAISNEYEGEIIEKYSDKYPDPEASDYISYEEYLENYIKSALAQIEDPTFGSNMNNYYSKLGLFVTRLSDSNSWTDQSTILPKTDSYGKDLTYTVNEIVPEGYTAEVTTSSDGYAISNTHEPEKIEIDIRKLWVDKNNRRKYRPEGLTVNIKRDGEIISSPVLSEDNGWSFKLSNQFKYHDKGQEYVYEIEEVMDNETMEHYSLREDTDVLLQDPDNPNRYFVSLVNDVVSPPNAVLEIVKNWEGEYPSDISSDITMEFSDLEPYTQYNVYKGSTPVPNDAFITDGEGKYTYSFTFTTSMNKIAFVLCHESKYQITEVGGDWKGSYKIYQRDTEDVIYTSEQYPVKTNITIPERQLTKDVPIKISLTNEYSIRRDVDFVIEKEFAGEYSSDASAAIGVEIKDLEPSTTYNYLVGETSKTFTSNENGQATVTFSLNSTDTKNASFVLPEGSTVRAVENGGDYTPTLKYMTLDDSSTEPISMGPLYPDKTGNYNQSIYSDWITLEYSKKAILKIINDVPHKIQPAYLTLVKEFEGYYDEDESFGEITIEFEGLQTDRTYNYDEVMNNHKLTSFTPDNEGKASVTIIVTPKSYIYGFPLTENVSYQIYESDLKDLSGTGDGGSAKIKIFENVNDVEPVSTEFRMTLLSSRPNISKYRSEKMSLQPNQRAKAVVTNKYAKAQKSVFISKDFEGYYNENSFAEFAVHIENEEPNVSRWYGPNHPQYFYTTDSRGIADFTFTLTPAIKTMEIRVYAPADIQVTEIAGDFKARAVVTEYKDDKISSTQEYTVETGEDLIIDSQHINAKGFAPKIQFTNYYYRKDIDIDIRKIYSVKDTETGETYTSNDSISAFFEKQEIKSSPNIEFPVTINEIVDEDEEGSKYNFYLEGNGPERKITGMKTERQYFITESIDMLSSFVSRSRCNDMTVDTSIDGVEIEKVYDSSTVAVYLLTIPKVADISEDDYCHIIVDNTIEVIPDNSTVTNLNLINGDTVPFEE